MLPFICHRKGVKMKYKNGQKVDIGDGDVWRIINIENHDKRYDDIIEIETIGSSEYRTLFVDESEILRLIEE